MLPPVAYWSVEEEKKTVDKASKKYPTEENAKSTEENPKEDED